MNIVEVGSDIVITGSGTIDLTLWSSEGSIPVTSGAGGSGGGFHTNGVEMEMVTVGVGDPGPGGSYLDVYTLDSPALTGPTSAGPLNFSLTGPPSASGDLVYWNFDGTYADFFNFGNQQGMLILPDGYSSGASLVGLSTIPGTSLASLGMTPASFVWSWGSGSSADSITLNIVPEPSTALLVCTGLLGLAWSGRHRNGCG
jgi:hypothetical protein